MGLGISILVFDPDPSFNNGFTGGLAGLVGVLFSNLVFNFQITRKRFSILPQGITTLKARLHEKRFIKQEIETNKTIYTNYHDGGIFHIIAIEMPNSFTLLGPRVLIRKLTWRKTFR